MRAAASPACADLLFMVTGMDEMEFQPLIHGKRSEDWMIHHFRAAKPTLRFHRRGIEPIEVAAYGVEHGTEIQFARWDHMLGRLTPFRKVAKVQQCKSLQLLLQGRRGRERGIFLEATLEAFRIAQIRALQVFDDLAHRPPIGIAPRRALGAATARGALNHRETLLEVRVHWGSL